MSQVVRLPSNSYKPITNTAWVRARLCKSQKRCIRLAAASHNVNQLRDHGRWFSPGTLASSTTKTGRHDIAEILLKVALNTKNQSHWLSVQFQNPIEKSQIEALIHNSPTYVTIVHFNLQQHTYIIYTHISARLEIRQRLKNNKMLYKYI